MLFALALLSAVPFVVTRMPDDAYEARTFGIIPLSYSVIYALMQTDAGTRIRCSCFV